MASFDENEYMKAVLSPAEAAFRRDGSLPNYFARYGLPESVSDGELIRTTMDAVVKYWNKTKINAKYGPLLGQLTRTDELTGSRTVLNDPVNRTNYREMLAVERRKQRETRFRELDQSIRVVVGKGFLTQREFDVIIDKFGKRDLSEAEIRGRIRVDVREVPPAPQIPRLPGERMREMSGQLAVLQKKDLWRFLELPPRASAADVRAACDIKVREWAPKPPDNRKTAADRLISLARTLLVDGDPTLYENARLWELAEENLLHGVVMAASDERIDQAEFKNLLDIAAEHAIPATLATAYIRSLFDDGRVKGVIEAAAPVVDQVRCRTCSVLSPAGSTECANASCRAPLWTACPRCAKRAPMADPACPHCGFDPDEMARVTVLKSVLAAALDSNDLATARNTATELERLWGRRPDVEKLFERAATAAQAAEQLWGDVDAAVGRREPYKAKRLIEDLLRRDPEFAGRDGRRADVRFADLEREIEKVETLIRRGTELEAQGRGTDAFLAFTQALSFAADAAAATEGLARCKPESARQVTATFHGDHVVVGWKASASGGDIAYTVVRREERAPVSPTDGTEVGRTRDGGLVDREVKSGTFVFYAVFAVRAGAASAPAASDGVLAAAEVNKLVLSPAEGEISGSWEQPARCVVRVFRQEGAPPVRAGEGTAVEVTHRSFVDAPLTNGKTYGYRVCAEYRLPTGKVVLTPGVTAMARPEAPPAPITDLALAASRDGGLTLTWTAPPGGTVAIHRLSARPRWPRGATLTLEEVGALGTSLGARAGGISADDPSPPRGVCYYLPVTVAGDQVVAGDAREFVSIPDVSALELDDFGSYIQLRWAWPEGCTLVTVAWRPDTFPRGHDDRQAKMARLTRGEYEVLGGFKIERPEAVPYRIKVFAGATLEGVARFSSGLTPDCQGEVRVKERATVAYRLSRGVIRRNRVTIRLSATEPHLALPELVVVVKRGGDRPLDAEDGKVVKAIPRAALPANQDVVYDVDLADVASPAYLRLFFKDRRSYDQYKLDEPPTAEMKVK